MRLVMQLKRTMSCSRLERIEQHFQARAIGTSSGMLMAVFQTFATCANLRSTNAFVHTMEFDTEKDGDHTPTRKARVATAFLATARASLAKSQLPYGLTANACLSVGINVVSAVGLVSISSWPPAVFHR
jgi:hypothetical protein